MDSDGGFVTDGCDGMNIVAGSAPDGHLTGLPQLVTGRRQCRARGGRQRLEVPDLAFDSRVDADDAPTSRANALGFADPLSQTTDAIDQLLSGAM